MMPPFGAAAHQTAELIENVGIVADRLLAACTSGIHPDNVDPRSMLEQALIVAAEAQQQLAAQKERIATLETLSLTDELTALYNRRGFAQEFRRTLALAQRLDSNGVLAYIDLDQFKAVNDGAGHQAGDAVLRHVAEILSSNLRATDMVARVGGDEFAAILVHTSEQSGLRRATALERLLNSTVVQYEDYEIPVSASLGVVPFGANDTTETLIAQADAMMYRAKRAKPRNLHAWRKRTV